MTERAVPLALHQMTRKLVHLHHAQHGVGDMVLRLSENENLIVLMTSGAERFTAMNEGAKAFTARKAVWLVAVVLFATSFFISYWLLLGLVACAVLDRFLARRQSESYMYQTSYLLALEMLVHDFAGWGAAFPSERARASKMLGSNSVQCWLDFYLPRRSEMSTDAIAAASPSSGLWSA